MTDITLIFPDQLFLDHPCIVPGRVVYLAEDYLFFKVQRFHKQRIVLLKCAMRKYAELLRRQKLEVIHIPSNQLEDRGSLRSLLKKKGVKNLHIAEFADDWLYNDFTESAKSFGWKIHFYRSPGFLCSNQELNEFFSLKKRFSMAQFYAYQRKSRNILMTPQGPVGGKYSFDIENRKKLPKNHLIPKPFLPKKNLDLEIVTNEVEREFPDAIGEATPFLYPVDHQEAENLFEDFLKNKFQFYGDYQDAIQKEDSILYHSMLSPVLNIGLLTPEKVLEKTLKYAEKHQLPFNCLEGFIRQILGWREFVRASYLIKGVFQRSSNYFNHHEVISPKFWYGKTGFDPIDTVIHRVLKTGYCNHIERLMVLGNFLLLTETDPHEVYTWFMGCFVDAYDWVMVPNVYGMSQFADGGSITTKPYISSSNYILKMGNYPKGAWAEIWDGLFWRFLKKHRSTFSSNIRTANLLKMLDKNEQGISPKIHKAELWLKNYRND